MCKVRKVKVCGVDYTLYGMAEHAKLNKMTMQRDSHPYFIPTDEGHYVKARDQLWYHAMKFAQGVMRNGFGSYSNYRVANQGYKESSNHPADVFYAEMRSLFMRNLLRDDASYHRIHKHIKSALRRYFASAQSRCKSHSYFMTDKELWLAADYTHPITNHDLKHYLGFRNYVVCYVVGYYPAWPFISEVATKSDARSVQDSRWHGNLTGIATKQYYPDSYYSNPDNDKVGSVFQDNEQALLEIFGKLKRKATKVVNGLHGLQTYSSSARDVLNKYIPDEVVRMGLNIMADYVGHMMARVFMGCIRITREDTKNGHPTCIFDDECGWTYGILSVDMTFGTTKSTPSDARLARRQSDYESGLAIKPTSYQSEWNAHFRKHRYCIQSPKNLPTVTRCLVKSRTMHNYMYNTQTPSQQNATASGMMWFKGVDAGFKFEYLLDDMYSTKIDNTTFGRSCVSVYQEDKKGRRGWDDARMSSGLSSPLDREVSHALNFIGTPAYEKHPYISGVRSIRSMFVTPRFFDRVFARGLTWSGGMTTHVYSKPRDIGSDMIVYEGVRIDHGCDMSNMGATQFQKYVDSSRDTVSQHQRVFVKHKPTGVTFAIKCDTMKPVTVDMVNGRKVFSNLPRYDDVCQHEVSKEITEAFSSFLAEMETMDSMRIFSTEGRHMHDSLEEDLGTKQGFNLVKMKTKYLNMEYDLTDPMIATNARALVKKLHRESGNAIATAHDCRNLAGHIIAPMLFNHAINCFNSIFIRCHDNLYMSRTGPKDNSKFDDHANDTYRIVVADSHGSAVTEHVFPWCYTVDRWKNEDMQLRNDVIEVGKSFISSTDFPSVIRSKTICNK